MKVSEGSIYKDIPASNTTSIWWENTVVELLTLEAGKKATP